MAETERIISERVVSRKVIGSANPIARKFRDIKGKIGGICAAPIFAILAFLLLFGGEKLAKSSEIVEELDLEQATSVTADSGMHKMEGTPEIVEAAVAPELGNVLYYKYTQQEYEEVEEKEYETVTKIENGQEVEETIERTKLVEKWVDGETKSAWATFKLGRYTIDPEGAKMEIDVDTKTYYENYLGEYDDSSAGRADTPDIGDRRMIVEYLPTDEQLLVVGEISGTMVKGGEAFIISNKGNEGLVSDLKSSESAVYWAMKIGAWLFFTLAILSLLGPILAMVDFIPLVGKSATCAASIIAAIIAFVIVLMGTLIIKFWYVFVILMVLGFGVLIAILILVLTRKKGGKETTADTTTSAK